MVTDDVTFRGVDQMVLASYSRRANTILIQQILIWNRAFPFYRYSICGSFPAHVRFLVANTLIKYGHWQYSDLLRLVVLRGFRWSRPLRFHFIRA